MKARLEALYRLAGAVLIYTGRLLAEKRDEELRRQAARRELDARIDHLLDLAAAEVAATGAPVGIIRTRGVA